MENNEGIVDVEDNNAEDKTDNLNHRKQFYCFTLIVNPEVLLRTTLSWNICSPPDLETV